LFTTELAMSVIDNDIGTRVVIRMGKGTVGC